MILSKNAKLLKPIVGIEFRYNNKLLYIGLAKNAGPCGNEPFSNPT
jgi:hypothetical protein